MQNKLIFAFFLSLFCANINAQTCTGDHRHLLSGAFTHPLPDSSDTGPMPSGWNTPLHCGVIGDYYEFTFTVVTRLSADQSQFNFPIGHWDVLNIQGLPPGIDYTCDSAGTTITNGVCVFTASQTSVGCIRLSGVPTTAGIYPIVFKTKIYLPTQFPISVNQSIPSISTDPLQFRGRYVLNVFPNAASSCYLPISNRERSGNLSVKITPNPTDGVTLFTIGAKKYTDKGKFTVSDALGRQIAQQIITLDGIEHNIVQFDCANLEQGVYLYTIEADGERLSNRFVVQH